MITAPNVVVAGDPGLARKLRSTGRFPAVIEVASATALRDLSENGGVPAPAAVLFAPGFTEDLPGMGVPLLADGLAADGFTVLVHAFFTERGDVFDPAVIATAQPMTLADLLATLDAVRPDLHPEPPPDPWTATGSAVQDEPPDEARIPRDDTPAWLENALAKATAHEDADRSPAGSEVTGAPAEGLRTAPETPAGQEPPREPSSDETPPRPHGRAQGQDETPGPPQQDAPIPEQRPAPRSPRYDQSVWEQEHARAVAMSSALRRRRVVVAAAALVLAVAGVGGALLAAGPETAERRPRAQHSPPPAPSTAVRRSAAPASSPTPIRPVKKYVPGKVRIVDGRVSIEVVWTDGSGGRAAHYVVGGPAGRTPSTLASAPPGTTKVEVTALNPGVDYCLTVVAVMDVDRVAHAEPVCTRRVRRDG